jgi:hypothetical protein
MVSKVPTARTSAGELAAIRGPVRVTREVWKRGWSAARAQRRGHARRRLGDQFRALIRYEGEPVERVLGRVTRSAFDLALVTLTWPGYRRLSPGYAVLARVTDTETGINPAKFRANQG